LHARPGYLWFSSADAPSPGARNWSSGFMPSSYQGVPFRSKGDPILYLSNPQGVSPATQRAALDALDRLNDIHLRETGDLEIASRIAAYELAFRMQSAGPELLDFSKEPAHILAMYGVNREITRPSAVTRLLARH